MTYQYLETRIRDLVNDTVEDAYRFSSAAIWGYVGDAVRQLRKIRPSERYDPETGALDDGIPAPSAATDEIRFDPRFEEAIIDYAAYRIYQLDMTDTVNAQMSENFKVRAEALMQL